MEHKVFGIPRPNVVLYLSVPFEVSHDYVSVREYSKGRSPARIAENLSEVCVTAAALIFEPVLSLSEGEVLPAKDAIATCAKLGVDT